MNNKLSYLGFLGLLGFAGFVDWPLFFFFGNFYFFAYNKTVADELFWQNVQVSATRAFFLFFAFSTIMIVATCVLVSLQVGIANVSFVSGFTTITIICQGVFTVSLGALEGAEQIDMQKEND